MEKVKGMFENRVLLLCISSYLKYGQLVLKASYIKAYCILGLVFMQYVHDILSVGISAIFYIWMCALLLLENLFFAAIIHANLWLPAILSVFDLHSTSHC